MIIRDQNYVIKDQDKIIGNQNYIIKNQNKIIENQDYITKNEKISVNILVSYNAKTQLTS